LEASLAAALSCSPLRFLLGCATLSAADEFSLVSQSLIDEIDRRSLRFVQSCLHHERLQMINRPGKRYPIGISLPWPIADALDAFCKRTNTKRSEVIDEALRTFLQIETRAEQIRRLALTTEGQDENSIDIFGGNDGGSGAG
jgi:hypothetical protein